MFWAGGATAWEARLGEICELTHDTPEASWRITYDPAIGQYAITIRLVGATWDPHPIFAIRFSGARELTITTDRHVISPDGHALTVTDRGFGNVLNGLEFNTTAIAISGDLSVGAGLTGPDPAAPAVAAFRACAVRPLAGLGPTAPLPLQA
jgi:hypothetical protein